MYTAGLCDGLTGQPLSPVLLYVSNDPLEQHVSCVFVWKFVNSRLQ